MSRLGGKDSQARMRLLAVLLLTLRGTPFLYYGDEIGMRNGLLKRKDLVDPVGQRYWPFHIGRDPAAHTHAVDQRQWRRIHQRSQAVAASGHGLRHGERPGPGSGCRFAAALLSPLDRRPAETSESEPGNVPTVAGRPQRRSGLASETRIRTCLDRFEFQIRTGDGFAGERRATGKRFFPRTAPKGPAFELPVTQLAPYEASIFIDTTTED